VRGEDKSPWHTEVVFVLGHTRTSFGRWRKRVPFEDMRPCFARAQACRDPQTNQKEHEKESLPATGAFELAAGAVDSCRLFSMMGV
jgi:hypothetical protein